MPILYQFKKIIFQKNYYKVNILSIIKSLGDAFVFT